MPSAIIGLKSKQKNDPWEKTQFVIGNWLEPSMRIQLVYMGIFSALPLYTAIWRLGTTIILILTPFTFIASAIWFFATFKANYEDE